MKNVLSVRGSPAALTMMNTFKLCSTYLQKSPFASTSKAFPPPGQWYIHAGSLYMEVGVSLYWHNAIQNFICYYFKKKSAFHGNLFVACDIGIAV